jgi:hypothetical protein
LRGRGVAWDGVLEPPGRAVVLEQPIPDGPAVKAQWIGTATRGLSTPHNSAASSGRRPEPMGHTGRV